MMGTTYSSQDTYLNRLDARTKLILLVAVFTLVLIFSHPLYIIALLALVMVAWGSARIPFGRSKPSCNTSWCLRSLSLYSRCSFTRVQPIFSKSLVLCR